MVKMLLQRIGKVLLILSSLIHTMVCMKVLSFTSTSSSLSYSTLTRGMPRELPDQFILCISHKQARVDNRGAFQILGEDGRPWLALLFYIPPKARFATEFELWGLLPRYEHLGTSGQLKLGGWVQTCIKLDTRENGYISVNVDGRIIEVNKTLNLNMPKSLNQRLLLGKSNPDGKETQFSGLVSNVRIFSSVDSWPSCEDPGDLLQWNISQWTNSNGEVQEKIEEICAKEATSALAIPYRLPQGEAERACSKLAHGKMAAPRNKDELFNFISWAFPLLSNISNVVWTPFTNHEGVVYDENKNRVDVGSLPGLGNGVIIDLVKKRMEYSTPSWPLAFSCKIRESTILLLRGLTCKTAFLGWFHHLFMYDIPSFQICCTPL